MKKFLVFSFLIASVLCFGQGTPPWTIQNSPYKKGVLIAVDQFIDEGDTSYIYEHGVIDSLTPPLKLKNSPTIVLRLDNDSLRADIKKVLNRDTIGGQKVFLSLRVDSTGQLLGFDEILSDDFDGDPYGELQELSVLDSVNRVIRLQLSDGGIAKFRAGIVHVKSNSVAPLFTVFAIPRPDTAEFVFTRPTVNGRTFYAGPNATPGTMAVPTFRSIVAADVPTLNQNTTGSAGTLTTGRTISITGDLSYTSPTFNGSSNITGVGTLATVNSNVGTFQNATITVNGKGLVTAASTGVLPRDSTGFVAGWGLNGTEINNIIYAEADSLDLMTKYAGTLKEDRLTFTPPLARSSNTISIPAANSSTSGHLTSTDWNRFNDMLRPIGNADWDAAIYDRMQPLFGNTNSPDGFLAGLSTSHFAPGETNWGGQFGVGSVGNGFWYRNRTFGTFGPWKKALSADAPVNGYISRFNASGDLYNSGLYDDNTNITSSRLLKLDHATPTYQFLKAGSPIFMFGDEDNIWGGSSGNISLFAYGNREFNISTNSVKRFKILGSGVINILSLAGTGDRMTIAKPNGDLDTAPMPTGTIAGSGTTNYVAKFTSSSEVGNSQIFDNGTNVGIGTASPTAKLEVLGRARIRQGTDNLFINGGNTTLSGNSNIALGDNSMPSISSGNQNIALGASSLANLTSGSENFALGFQSQALNLSGVGNVAVGNQSLYSSTTGIYNTAIGAAGVLGLNTTDFNTSIGAGSTVNSTEGYRNTTIGANAFNSGDGNRNVVVGAFAMQSGTGSGKSLNTALGYMAGQNVTGSGNVLLGFEAGKNQTAISNVLAIENSSSATYLIGGRFDSDRVGINKATADIEKTLHVGGDVRIDGLAGATTRMATILPTGDISTAPLPTGTVTGVTASLPLSSSGGAAPNITIDTTSTKGVGTQYGLALKQDKLQDGNGIEIDGANVITNTKPFNNIRLSADNGTQFNLVDGGLLNFNATTPLTVFRTSGNYTLGIGLASSANTGALSNTDWNTFNNKENPLTFSSPLSRSTNTISLPAASTSVSGHLTSTDWNTFNGKIGGTGTTGTIPIWSSSTQIGNSPFVYNSFIPALQIPAGNSLYFVGNSTIIDKNSEGGSAGQILSKATGGGLDWINQPSLNWGSKSGSTVPLNLGTSSADFKDGVGTSLVVGGSPTSLSVDLAGQALAVHNLASNGLITRTGSGAVSARTITQGQGILVTNGNGVAGNPTIAFNQAYDGLTNTANSITLALDGTFRKVDFDGILTGEFSSNSSTDQIVLPANGTFEITYNGDYNLSSSSDISFSLYTGTTSANGSSFGLSYTVQNPPTGIKGFISKTIIMLVGSSPIFLDLRYNRQSGAATNITFVSHNLTVKRIR
jgi:hypothetical protein